MAAGTALAACGSSSPGDAATTSSTTGTAASGTPSYRPNVVQVHEASLAGGGHGVPGPHPFSVDFTSPTRAGDLLVVAVVDGVLRSGMTQPNWNPVGWKVAAQTIGGNLANGGSGGYATGGLEAKLFYLPDNPGGITQVHLGSIPRGTQSDVTAFAVELAGVPRQLSVDASGASTSGATPTTDTTVSAVRTTTPLAHAPDLVLALFVNGGNAPAGERYVVPQGWHVLAKERSVGTVNEPLLLDERVVRQTGAVAQRVEYHGGYPIDNCAVIAALH